MASELGEDLFCRPRAVPLHLDADERAPVDLAHLDWGPGGWTFCDAARERAIATLLSFPMIHARPTPAATPCSDRSKRICPAG